MNVNLEIHAPQGHPDHGPHWPFATYAKELPSGVTRYGVRHASRGDVTLACYTSEQAQKILSLQSKNWCDERLLAHDLDVVSRARESHGDSAENLVDASFWFESGVL